MFVPTILWAVCALLLKTTKAEDTNYFCTDLEPQCDISIERLLGMWYGIEFINHMEEERYVRDDTLSCPVLHISAPSDSFSPLYKNYDKNYGYGRGYNYGERREHYNNENRREQQQREYQNQYYQRFGYNMKGCNQDEPGYRVLQGNEMKSLRIWWEENGVDTEYQLRYYNRRKGFWISSGPKNGSELVPQLRHFAGTVQVIKAVGSHMVLTFCHQQPDRKLFTIILSREIKPNFVDIPSIHRLLNLKGLRSLNVKQQCSISGCLRGTATGFMLILIFICKLFV